MINLEELRWDKHIGPSLFGRIDANTNHNIVGDSPLHALMDHVGLSNRKWLPIGVVAMYGGGQNVIFLLCIERKKYFEDKNDPKYVTAFNTKISIMDFLNHLSRFHLVLGIQSLDDDFILKEVLNIRFGKDLSDNNSLIDKEKSEFASPWD